MLGMTHTADWGDFGTRKYKITFSLTNLLNIEL